jgi:hypothetical protein
MRENLCPVAMPVIEAETSASISAAPARVVRAVDGVSFRCEPTSLSLLEPTAQEDHHAQNCLLLSHQRHGA